MIFLAIKSDKSKYFLHAKSMKKLKNLNTYFTLKNSLFGAVKLTRNADPDK